MIAGTIPRTPLGPAVIHFIPNASMTEPAATAVLIVTAAAPHPQTTPEQTWAQPTVVVVQRIRTLSLSEDRYVFCALLLQQNPLKALVSSRSHPTETEKCLHNHSVLMHRNREAMYGRGLMNHTPDLSPRPATTDEIAIEARIGTSAHRETHRGVVMAIHRAGQTQFRRATRFSVPAA